MKRLHYLPSGQLWYFPNVQLCKWKIKKLKATGNYSGEFKIENV